MASSTKSCPECKGHLEQGFVYVRGIGAAMFWSESGDTGLMSRKNLEQINLGNISETDAGAQAVIKAWRCPSCEFVCFRRV